MNSSGSGNVKISVSLTWTSDNVSHVLINGRYVVAEHIYRHDSMCPMKWKCINECQLFIIGKIEVVSMYKGRSRGRRGGVGVGGEE